MAFHKKINQSVECTTFSTICGKICVIYTSSRKIREADASADTMPLTLRQLQHWRDNCLEKLEELKSMTNEIGGNELGTISIQPYSSMGCHN